MRKNLLMGLPCILISLSAIGQDSTTTVTTLREVVVSASRAEQPLIEIPRSVTVISSDVIEKSVYQSLGDLLNNQSGIYVVGANQTPGTNQNVFMRGANSNQVAVMIDGVRITDASSPNAAIDLSEISLSNVERVEIIRGSHSTMFGGAAIGGVINIITKTKRIGLHGLAGLQAGMFGKRAFSFNENVDIQYGFKNGFYVNGAAFQQNAKGIDATEKAALKSFTSDNDDFEKSDFSVKTGYKDDSWDAFVSIRDNHQRADIDKGAFSDDDNSYLKFDRTTLQYRLGYTINPSLQFSLIGSSGKSKRFYEDDSSKVSETAYDKIYSRGSYSGRLQTHELQLNYEKKHVRGLLGAGVYYEKMFFDSYLLSTDPGFGFELSTNYDFLDMTANTRYIFTQLGYGWSNFNFSAGARLNNHSTAGTNVTFEVNPSYTLQEFLFYGSVSTGFNAPSLYQLYDPSKSFTAYTTRGNRNLQPERSLSAEVGIKKEFTSGSYFTVSAFQTVVENAIEYVFLWNNTKPIDQLDYSDDRGDTYINVAEQTAKGLEIESSVFVTKKLSINANATLLRGTIRVRQEDLNNQPTGGNHVQLYNLGVFLSEQVQQRGLVRRPDLTAFAQVSYKPSSAWILTTSYRYTGSRFDSGYDFNLGPYGALKRLDVSSYHLVDIGFQWQASKVFAIGVQVENVFDEAYSEVVGFQTTGRSGYLKLTARW